MKARSAVSSEPVAQEVARVLINGSLRRIVWRDGIITAIEPMEGTAEWLALPLPVDPHVHLDKTYTIARCTPQATGLFAAIEAQHADMTRWDAADIRYRAERALEEAWRGGFRALRSHVDWTTPEIPIAWSVLGELAEEWRDRIVIQRAALCPLDLLGDQEAGPMISAAVARTPDGVLGAFVYRDNDMDEKLDRVFNLAQRHDLQLDFHVDEGLEPEAEGIDAIVSRTARFGMAKRVLCGHCCALSVRPCDAVERVLDQAADAGVGLTVLPTTNAWLQDVRPGRTPRLRGLAPLLEARAAGIDVLLGTDNVGDPFFPYGSYDALDIHRLAVIAAHLDPAEWADAITTLPASWLGLASGIPMVGARADFMLIRTPDWLGAVQNPRAERRVFRAGFDILTSL